MLRSISSHGRVQTGCLQLNRCTLSMLLTFSEHEEQFDGSTFKILWDLATNHPESGVCKMTCIEYYDVSIEESGILRKGQAEVWFKDLVHDVCNDPSLESDGSFGISHQTNFRQE